MNYGAFDFIEKPFQAKRLIVTLCNAIRQSTLSHQLESYKKCERRQYHKIIGMSKPMQTVYQIIDNVAASKASILINGESGTGKELCAEAIFKESQRKDKPFITLNCAAIPKNLIETEIFGHVKGAFTNAISNRQGAASQADGGTLFLDEIGDMDLQLQSMLLRFIQMGTFQKVGGNKLETVDVRFICATHRNLLTEIQLGRFREDLYFRLNVIQISLPALRERGKDILLIAQTFLTKFAKMEGKSFNGFTSEVQQFFMNYDWPGNIRQLENVIYNIVLLHENQLVTTDMLPKFPNKLSETESSTAAMGIQQQLYPICLPIKQRPKQIRPLWQVEKEVIEEAIEFCNGNITQAAKLLQVSKSSIYNKLQLWKTKQVTDTTP